MLTVIINAFHGIKNILPTNDSQLSKICLRIHAFQGEVNQTQHQSPKERLRIAIEQLGNKTIETSLAVINDLEQIAQNHPQYHWIIMDILTTFVRENAPYMPQEKVTSNLSTKVRVDIQAALTVIARRNVNKDPKNEQLDLSHTDMRGANLNRANLEQTNLYQANLAGANLTEANLAGAILSAANLESTNLYLANLEGAILSAANLTGANLEGANLHCASLYLAGLHGAVLNDAILDGANLREAKFSE
ncbi:pentapeptide repeat-containing protein [Nostoc sphaeroides]|uniref:Pentapeptide repeat-containing protein n=1 Tax=Nostoc sphaeroides CCNUC1 TaxID=2653204 RepID=A0A5P8W2H9_9NOSO|nr:pentapeptide repeat-containing protein [Nostoc sphaeroides]MCC5630814.1 pentapeptide repeat-containing protein [Nostoc sphaeroides CHAB 2801]QFS46862.1 pentapeptide repeat-containing protein [Nostoc sphaeroides CCNUC1]